LGASCGGVSASGTGVAAGSALAGA
jgi:hypothetical protein